MTQQRRRQLGFTLIEVLVALGIVAVALMAGLKATGALSHNAERQTASLLGQICAENELIRLRLRRQLPDTGNSQTECLQAGNAVAFLYFQISQRIGRIDVVDTQTQSIGRIKLNGLLR